MSIGNAVQAAIYTALNTALSVSVYDSVPQGTDSGDSAQFPYVVIGEDTVNAWDTNTEVGFTVTVVVHTWSRAKGRKETKTLQGQIYNTIHRQTLSISGYHFVSADFENGTSFLDSDGETRHGVQTFRFIIDQL